MKYILFLYFPKYLIKSERQFLEHVKSFKKKVVIILSKLDTLETEEELKEIVGFVSKQATTLLEETPLVFPVSSRLALRAKQCNIN